MADNKPLSPCFLIPDNPEISPKQKLLIGLFMSNLTPYINATWQTLIKNQTIET